MVQKNIQYKLSNNIDGSSTVTFNGRTSFDNIVSIEATEADFSDLQFQSAAGGFIYSGSITNAKDITTNTLNSDAITNTETITTASISFPAQKGLSGFTVNDSSVGSTLWTLPAKDGNAGQLLSTDGNTQLSFVSSVPVTTPQTATGNIIVTADSKTLEASSVTIGLKGDINSGGNLSIGTITASGSISSQGNITALSNVIADSIIFPAGLGFYGFTGRGGGIGTTIWSLPTGDGTDDQVLATDGSGNLNFIDSLKIVSPQTEAGNIIVSSNYNQEVQESIVSIDETGDITTTGNINGANISASGDITATENMNANQISFSATAGSSGFTASSETIGNIMYVLPPTAGFATQILTATEFPVPGEVLQVLSTTEVAVPGEPIQALSTTGNFLAGDTQLYWTEVEIPLPAGGKKNIKYEQKVPLYWQTQPEQVERKNPDEPDEPTFVEDPFFPFPIPIFWGDDNNHPNHAPTINGEFSIFGAPGDTGYSPVGVNNTSGQITATPVVVSSVTGDIVTPGTVQASEFIFGQNSSSDPFNPTYGALLTLAESPSQEANIKLTFPPTVGSNNQVLTTDGSNGTLSWTNVANVNPSGNNQNIGFGTLNGIQGVVIFTEASNRSAQVFVTRNIEADSLPSVVTIGNIIVGSIIDNVSFTVYSTVANDYGSFNWFIVNP